MSGTYLFLRYLRGEDIIVHMILVPSRDDHCSSCNKVCAFIKQCWCEFGPWTSSQSRSVPRDAWQWRVYVEHVAGLCVTLLYNMFQQIACLIFRMHKAHVTGQLTLKSHLQRRSWVNSSPHSEISDSHITAPFERRISEML